MNLTEEEFRKRVDEIGSTYSEFDNNFYIECFRVLSTECNNDKEVARLCYEFDKKGAYELMFLAILGNIETEKYFRILLKTIDYLDDMLDCAIGLAALDIDEGFVELEKILRGPQVSPYYGDVFDLLEFIDNSRANKMKNDIFNGEYGEKAKEYAKKYTQNPKYSD